jgi:hypothetical protein
MEGDLEMTAELDLPRRLALSYSVLARGLYDPSSESLGDATYAPFSVAIDSAQELTPETFRAALNLASFWDIDPSYGDQNVDEWFADTIANFRDPSEGDNPDHAVAYEYLQRTMNATLDGPLQRWVVTTWNKNDMAFHFTRSYVFGRVENGGLAGLVARLVWT